MDKKEYAFAGINISGWCGIWNPNGIAGGVCSRENGHIGPHVAHHNPSGVEFARWDGESPKPDATIVVNVSPGAGKTGFAFPSKPVTVTFPDHTAILTRALAFLVDSNQYEDRAMTAARREQRRELVRDIKQAVKPGK